MTAVSKIFTSRRRKWHGVFYHPDKGIFTGEGSWARSGVEGEAEKLLCQDIRLQLIGMVQYTRPVTKGSLIEHYTKYAEYTWAQEFFRRLESMEAKGAK